MSHTVIDPRFGILLAVINKILAGYYKFCLSLILASNGKCVIMKCIIIIFQYYYYVIIYPV